MTLFGVLYVVKSMGLLGYRAFAAYAAVLAGLWQLQVLDHHLTQSVLVFVQNHIIVSLAGLAVLCYLLFGRPSKHAVMLRDFVCFQADETLKVCGSLEQQRGLTMLVVQYRAIYGWFASYWCLFPIRT